MDNTEVKMTENYISSKKSKFFLAWYFRDLLRVRVLSWPGLRGTLGNRIWLAGASYRAKILPPGGWEHCGAAVLARDGK